MSLISFVPITALAVSVLVSVYMSHRYKKASLLHRLALIALPPLTVIFAFLLVGSVIGLVVNSRADLLWEASRLTPLFGLANGYNLYYGPTEGPITGIIYGPFAYATYIFSLVANSPTTAVLVGFASNILFISLTVLLLIRQEVGTYKGHHLVALFGLLFFTGWVVNGYFTYFMTYTVHSDAPALICATAACACVYTHASPSSRRIIAAALLSVVAVWAKQTTVPVIAAISVYIFFAHGIQPLARFILHTMWIGLTISTIILVAFGPYDVLLNVLIVPSQHPFRSALSWQDMGNILYISWTNIGITGAALTVHALSTEGVYPNKLKRFLGDPATLFLVAALLTLPTSILGAKKLGGNFNSLHFLHYMNLYCTVIFVRMLVSARQDGWYLAGKVLALSLPCLWVFMNLSLFQFLGKTDQIYSNDLERAYTFAKGNPDTAYFPWHPLVTLMANGNLYHFWYGLFDRELAGFEITQDHFLGSIPHEPKYIVFPGRNWRPRLPGDPTGQRDNFMRYLDPAYKKLDQPQKALKALPFTSDSYKVHFVHRY